VTEREKMLAGELYNAGDPELVAGRARARELTRAFNANGDLAVLRELLGRVGDGVNVEAPFYCDYGTNLELGDGTFVNFNCVILDCAHVVIGARVQFAPAVQIYTATHPVDPDERAAGLEYALPITIENDAWLGGGAIVLPGVTVGAGAVVAAGAVVTRDVPSRTVVAGNPARVVRSV
jgi:maltose O-acetyltransferase